MGLQPQVLFYEVRYPMRHTIKELAAAWKSSLPRRRINAFLRSPAYVLALCALTAVSYLFSLDIYLFSLFILIGVYTCLSGEDLLPIAPMVILGYIASSPSNNPGSAGNTGSVFLPENGGYYLLAIAGLFVLCLLIRLITDPVIGGKHFLKAKRPLLPGMLLLGGAYLLSGIGMSGYTGLAGRNLLFAFLQLAAVALMYVLFSGGVLWEKTPKDYLAWIGLGAGFVVAIELMENYLSGRIFMPGTDTIDRELIYTGWGMHNNIGGVMAMMLPFPFYLAFTKKRSWIYSVLASCLMLFVVLSCSRTSMLVAAAAFLGGVVLLLHKQEHRGKNLFAFGGTVLAAVVLAAVFMDKLQDIFDLFFEELLIMSQRDNLVYYGIKQFLQNPVFGGSFFPQGEYVPWDWADSAAFSAFFPPRWHNTLVQIAASCGIVGLAAYGFHRAQTVKAFWKRRTVENRFIAMSLLVLIACSLMDCHFFNIGPVLFYSMSLSFAENLPE